MARCCNCGCEFDLEEAKDDYYDQFKGDPDYDDQFPDGDMCGECAILDTKSNLAAGAELIELMGSGYDDD